MRQVRFNIHPKEAEIADAIGMGNAPDGVTGDGFFAIVPITINKSH